MTSFSAGELTRDLGTITSFLDRLRIPYLLVGGLALSLWGRPRTTLDLDFLVQLDQKGLEKLKRGAQRENMKVDARWLKWNPLLRKSQVRLCVGNVAVDILLPRDAHDRAAFERKRRCKLGDRSYVVVSPEDLVLQKLKVGRPRDFEDALTVLARRRGKLDRSYLRRWAKKLGIRSELDYVLSV